MTEEYLCQTKVSAKWLSEILLKEFNLNSDGIYLENFRAETIGDNVGFLSHIFCIDLNWSENAPNKLPTSVIVKAPTVDKIEAKLDDFRVPQEEKQNVLMNLSENMLKRYHRNECNFYKLGMTRCLI